MKWKTARAFETPEQELVAILRAALLCPAESPSLGPEAVEDWGTVIDKAVEERMAALLQSALRDLRWLPGLPAEAAFALKGHSLSDGAKGLRHRASIKQLLEALAREGVPVVLLKGAALALSLYRDYSERQLRDIDLLIPKAQVGVAEGVLSGLGFQPVHAHDDGVRLSFSCERTFQRLSPFCVVEVHWHLFNHPAEIERIPIEWFWERVEPLSLDGIETMTLGPGALLLHLASHFYLHHSGEGLLWSLDIALLLSRHGERIPWAEVVEAADRFGVLDAVTNALQDAGRRWGVESAEGWLEQHLSGSAGFRRRLVFGIASAPHSEAGILSNVFRLKGMDRKAAYLKSALYPSSDYMMARYRLRHRRQLPFCYAKRLARGVFLLARSIGSVAANLLRVFGKRR